MTVTFPREDVLTTYPILTERFTLERQQEISRLRGGQTRARDLGPPIWKASYRSPRMGWDQCLDLEAILKSLDGGVRTFVAHDTRRPMPLKYDTGGFLDTGVIASVGAGGASLDISGLQPGFELSRADRFSFDYVDAGQNLKALIEVMETSIANGAGVITGVDIRPFLPAATVISSPVTFTMPAVLMNLEPGSVEFSDAGSLLGSVSFSASEYR